MLGTPGTRWTTPSTRWGGAEQLRRALVSAAYVFYLSNCKLVRIARASLVGERFGRLVVLSFAGNNRHSQSTWLCRCDCGIEKVASIGTLKSGATRSCGCLRREVSALLHTVVPDAAGRLTCKRCGAQEMPDQMASPSVCRSCESARHRAYYKARPERSRLATDTWRKSNPEKVAAGNSRRRAEHFDKFLFRIAKRRAAVRGLEFTITLQDVRIPEVCPVLGLVLSTDRQGRRKGFPLPFTPTLDRIDNTKGYVPGNVAVISWRANELKKDATLDELEKVLLWVRQQERRQ